MDKDAEKNKIILNKVGDLMSNFLYYDRKEDETLPPGEIERCIYSNIVTIDEIVYLIEKILRDDFKDYLADIGGIN